MTEHVKIKGVKPRIQYLANGILTDFTFPFAIFDTSDIKVYIDDELQESTLYNISSVRESNGGTVSFDIAPPDNCLVTIIRDLSIERTSDFQEGGALRADTLNDELDYQIACQQQIADSLNRTMVLPPYAVDSDVDFTLPTPQAGKAIVWSADGNSLENSTVEINALESTLNNYKTAAETAAETATEKAQIASDKADIATEKAQQAVDSVDNKANKDLDNITETGKISIISLGMPDYSAPVSKSNATDYTAETNGWLEMLVSCYNSTAQAILTLNGVSRMISTAGGNHLDITYVWIPIKKGTTYKVTYARIDAGQYINFYPCIGG